MPDCPANDRRRLGLIISRFFKFYFICFSFIFRSALYESFGRVSGGSIIAVSYEARAHGVKRNMQGKDALKLSPEIVLVRGEMIALKFIIEIDIKAYHSKCEVPTKHGKADLSIYKKAGNAVVNILKQRADACEKR